MSVSGELLCSFELLKPLDSSALKSHIKSQRRNNKRNSGMLNSPVSHPLDSYQTYNNHLTIIIACYCVSAERLAIYWPSTLALCALLQPCHEAIMPDLTAVQPPNIFAAGCLVLTRVRKIVALSSDQ